MSIRNYNAWIKAARKASKKTGGLSLPAARKAYKVASARVGRPLKGVDVKKHPRITRDAAKAALAKPKRGAAKVRKPVRGAAPKQPAVAGRPVVAIRKIRTIAELERLVFGIGEVEYVSTAEYRKK